MDTGISSLGGMQINGEEYFSVSTDDRGFASRIRKLAKENPGKVIVKKEAEENDGCLYVWLPKSWVRLSPPVKRNISDEERERRRQIMKNRNASSGDRNGNGENEPVYPFADPAEEIFVDEDDPIIY